MKLTDHLKDELEEVQVSTRFLLCYCINLILFFSVFLTFNDVDQHGPTGDISFRQQK